MTVKIRQLNHSACRRTSILTQDVTYRIYLSSFPSPIWNNHKQHLCNSFQQSRLMSMSETLLFTSVHDLRNLENYNCRLEWSFNDFVSSTHAHFLVFFFFFLVIFFFFYSIALNVILHLEEDFLPRNTLIFSGADWVFIFVRKKRLLTSGRRWRIVRALD